MPDTLFVPPRLVLPCTDTGTIATSDVVRQLAVVVEVAAQRTGAHREHDVVDRAAEGVLDLLDVVEVEAGERDAAVSGDRPVERRARCGERCGHRLCRGGRGRSSSGSPQRAAAARSPAAADAWRSRRARRRTMSRSRGRFGSGSAVLLRAEGRCVRFEAAQFGDQAGAADAVDGRVVHLRHDRRRGPSSSSSPRSPTSPTADGCDRAAGPRCRRTPRPARARRRAPGRRRGARGARCRTRRRRPTPDGRC